METELTIETEREKILRGYKETITEAHNAFCRSGQQVGGALLAAANYRREVGLQLKSLREATDSEGKKIIAHGEWEGLFATAKGKAKSCNAATFHFDHSTATRYIAFAKAYPEPINNITDIARDGRTFLEDAGEIDIPASDPRGNRQRPTSQRWLSTIRNSWGVISGIFEKKPVDTLTESDRDDLKAGLKPYVELYEKL